MGNSMSFDFPYPSRRMPVMGRNMVATSQPLAAQAGLAMLARGGNAVDAAIATAITLTVVEPTMNGIGSDAFALVWDGLQLHGLNASGRSPAAWTPEHFRLYSTMPTTGWDSVTVPGCVSAWAELSVRFGRLPFGVLFEPAIRYAWDGYAVSPITASAWNRARNRFAEFPEWNRVFAPDGHTPLAGEIWKSNDHALTLERIAETRGDAFYRGSLAEVIAHAAREEGGAMSLDDLQSHRCDWVAPVSQDYRGYTLHEIPPNGQGMAALIALAILQHFDVASSPVDSAQSLHLQIEAMKLALADAHRYISDSETMEFPPEALLGRAYIQERAKQLDPDRAGDPAFGLPRGGTVLLTAADSSGMMVSFIQSNYWGFGSGVVVPGTGIALQNRGCGFVLEKGHPNRVGPRKRPFHTIIPGFVTCNGQPVMAFGVMGGPIQAQGHVQIMVRLADYGQNPQAACDAPRWRVLGGRRVALERGHSADVVDQLRQMGHEIEILDFTEFGGAQLIHRLESGFYCGASDHRKDGQAAGY